MRKKKTITILTGLIEDVKSITYPEDGRVGQEVLKLKNAAKEIFPDNEEFIKQIDRVTFTPIVISMVDDNDEEFRSALERGKDNLIGIINAMISQVETFFPEDEGIEEKKKEVGTDVFIVHGQDDEMVHAIARVIKNFNLNPIILREQPNNGRTIIEKFEDYSCVDFAIILLSPDDEILLKDKKTGEYKNEITRTRQNVLFELGFFIGKLGRDRVVALYRQSNFFEFPSDYSGVIYKIYDDSGAWKLEIGKEMKAAGLTVDLNLLI